MKLIGVWPRLRSLGLARAPCQSFPSLAQESCLNCRTILPASISRSQQIKLRDLTRRAPLNLAFHTNSITRNCLVPLGMAECEIRFWLNQRKLDHEPKVRCTEEGIWKL